MGEQDCKRSTYLIKTVTGLGPAEPRLRKNHRKEEALGIALTFVFNFSLVPKAIQLLKEQESKERYHIQELLSSKN